MMFVIILYMTRKRVAEKRDEAIYIAMTKSERKVIEDARAVLEQSKGRMVSMREFVLLLCKKVYYEPDLISSDANQHIDDIQKNMTRIKLELANISASLNTISTMVISDAETED